MARTIQKQIIKENSDNFMILANRIPKDFFMTSGIGESDLAVHAGSYHLALREAGIEPYNIMVYSSTLPAIANQIEKPNNLVHGSVMETIMACANSTKGIRVTAGIIMGKLYDRETGQKHGGFVCEYNGNETEDEAKEILRKNLQELYTNGYKKKFELRDIEMHTKSFIPKKKYGTAIVALCFVNHVFPKFNY